MAEVINEAEEIIGDSPRKQTTTARFSTKSSIGDDSGDATSNSAEEADIVYTDDLAFRESLNTLRKQNIYTDIQLMSNGVVIPAHKHVLACGSKYFYGQFVRDDVDNPDINDGDDNKEATNNLLELDEHDPKVLELLVHFIYAGHVPDLHKQTSPVLSSLIKSGDFLQVEHLDSYLLQELQIQLDTNNFIHVLHLASKLGNQTATTKVVWYLIKNLDTVWVSTDFMEVDEDVMTKIFVAAADKLQSHDTLLQVALVWVKHRLDQRRTALEKLTASVDYSRISQSLARFLLHDHFILTSPLSLREDLTRVLVTARSTSRTDRGGREEANDDYFSPIRRSRCPEDKWETSIVVIGRDEANRGSVIRYYPAANQWNEVEDLGTSLEFKQGLGYHREKVFFIGGETCKATKLSTCYSFDLHTKRLTRLPDLIIPRSLPLVFGYDDSLYAAGGVGRFSTGGLSSVECLESLQSPLWKYKHAMREKRDNTAACCFVDDKVFLAGGGGARCEYFLPSRKTWHKVCGLPVDEFHGLTPCFAAASGRIFAFQYFKPQRAMYLDLERDEWFSVNVRGCIPEWITSLVGYESRIYTIDKSRKFHVFDSTTGTWSMKSKLPKTFLHPMHVAASSSYP